MPGEIIEVRILTDDLDVEEKPYELVIFKGGNGDWYVATVPQGERPLERAVRISTSGGASVMAPGLTAAITRAFEAIASGQGEGITIVRR